MKSILVLALALASQWSFAQSDTGLDRREFGLGQPENISQLPPGQLRRSLESLPAQAQARGLRWLQGFSFPAEDAKNLRADDQGGIFYVDMGAVQEAGTASDSPTTYADVPQSTLDDVFLLHSKPGAANTVIVDFDGHTITGTAWNGSVDPLYAVAYNTEGDYATFTNNERKKMVDIWHRIAEDLAPYDIDVTTEEPAALDRNTGRILITKDIDANGNVIYCNGCAGGVAYVGVWGYSNYHTYYSPALVFYNNLGSGFPPYVAEAGSHELGHNLGLSHDGTSSVGYYRGHGSGVVSWAPIMGVGYYENVTQWSKGEYADANNTQDDLAIIDGKLGYDADDHGDTHATATPLSVDANGTVLSSNPALDPHNELPNNKGVIELRNDVDMFSFEAGAGTVSFSVRPAWDAFYRSVDHRGANLDIEVELQNNAGTTIAVNEPTTETSASINASVGTGTYYLLVTGVGNATVPYSDYGSLGMYFIDGTVPPPAPDNNPPTPNPMTWASLPAAVSESAISMTATTAVDDRSAVEYNFRCVAGGPQGCVASGWQSSSSHTATGLAASTSYTFQVLARDLNGNETGASNNASATTFAPPPPPNAPGNLAANGISETAITLSWTDTNADETGYQVQRLNGAAWQTIATLGVNATGYTDSGLAPSTTYDYRVAAFRDSVFSGYATASGATQDPPPYTNFPATSDTSVSGSVSGTVGDVADDDTNVQSITERESGGKPANRHTYLEHRWNFNIGSGTTVTVFANAWRGAADADSFAFEYSTNGGASFAELFVVSSTDEANLQSAVIPGSPSGSIIIRVVDTDQSQGERAASTVFVDQLYIQVGNPSTDPPNGVPFDLGATAVSHSQIDLAWTNGSNNESGLEVDRSTDGSTWTLIADLPAGSTSYSDTGLAAETTYFYRVRAYNDIAASDYSAPANATTDAAPPISLTASGFKDKGKHRIDLSWDTVDTVDIYRNGDYVTTQGGFGWLDTANNNKGGGSYTHQVCPVGSDPAGPDSGCSNVTTTVF